MAASTGGVIGMDVEGTDDERRQRFTDHVDKGEWDQAAGEVVAVATHSPTMAWIWLSGYTSQLAAAEELASSEDAEKYAEILAQVFSAVYGKSPGTAEALGTALMRDVDRSVLAPVLKKLRVINENLADQWATLVGAKKPTPSTSNKPRPTSITSRPWSLPRPTSPICGS